MRRCFSVRDWARFARESGVCVSVVSGMEQGHWQKKWFLGCGGAGGE